MRKFVTGFMLIGTVFLAISGFAQNYTGATTSFPGCATSGCHDTAARPEFLQWVNTEHATAYDSISAFVQQTARCLECHTTGWDTTMTNAGADEFVEVDTTMASFNVTITDSVEFFKKTNVQCESCHGPVEFSVNHPPSMVDITAETCGTCHEGEHHPYIEEWEESKHVSSLESDFVPNSLLTGNPNCSGCHTREGFIQFVGTTLADTTAIEPNVAEPPGDAAHPIDCATCHDPHDPKHIGQLRLPPADLCIKCHNPEDAMPPDNPHHSTSSMWAGEGAAEFEGFTYRRQSAHQLFGATAEKRCIACHVFTTPFDAGPPVMPAATGHTFEPRIEGCMQTSCHVNGLIDTEGREFNHRGRQAVTDSLLNELDMILANASSADSMTAEFEAGLFNLRFVTNSGSHGVHNPSYAEDILVNTITHLKDVLTGIEALPDPSGGIPHAFALHQNYPNPFNPITKIRFDIAKAGHVKLTIFNAVGQEIKTLVDENLAPQVYEVSFEASDLPSGVYFYRLVTGEFTTTKKMILMR